MLALLLSAVAGLAHAQDDDEYFDADTSGGADVPKSAGMLMHIKAINGSSA